MIRARLSALDARPDSSGRWITLGAASAIVAISLAGFVLLHSAEVAAAQDGGGSTSNDYLTQGADVVASGPVRIKYEGPDGVVSLPNAGVVALSDELDLAVSVSPYPPTTFNVDVDLYLTDAAGQPVVDATITVEWDMVFMWHGPFLSEFRPVGDGHYVAPFDLFMFGPWEFVTRVTAPGYDQPEDLSLSIYIWPK
jgi:hypothetical protein